MSHETENWPFIPAKHYTKVASKRNVRLIVLHSMEAPEKGTTAEAVANYFANTDRPASAHVCVDNNSVVQSVRDNNVAFAAPGANHDGVHIEMAGFARQTADEWLDPYGVDMLNRAADVVAQYLLKYNLPCKKLSNDEIRRGFKGVCGHDQITAVYRKSTHTDPGPGFPWQVFMDLVKRFHDERLKAIK